MTQLTRALTGLLAVSLSGCATAGELLLPSSTLNRNGIVPVTFRMNQAITGSGNLSIHWSDSLGRVVEDRTIPVTLVDELAITFPLDLRRAVAMRNNLVARLSIEGKNLKGQVDNRNDEAHASFVARPPGEKWRDYHIIMWQPYPKELLPALEELGIDGGQFNGRNHALPDSFIDSNMRWYSENIGTDYYSEYHRYRADRIQHWSFLQAKALYKKDPASKEAFKRHPSLEDSYWRALIHDRLIETAQRNYPYRPFFYSLADESGIADLAAFWDFDFSDQSLVPMRRWLREKYPALAALNEEWGSDFANWDAVTPPTTHEAMMAKDDNFAAWADFKEWMDVSFADALRMGADAIHEVDPEAYVNIGGGQRPGWGGYDYARITKALNAIEPYDIGSNVEIIRSLNPQMTMLSTGFASGDWERQRVWRELFHGHRGLIIWDEKREYVGPGGNPGARGVAAGKYYNELRDGAAALVINSQPVVDPIAIHYSQASMRTDWMLTRRPGGDAWIDRGAKVDRTDDDFLRLRESWCEMIEDQGLQYNFFSYDQLEAGELLKGGYRVLVLPRSNSLSSAEVSAIRDFIAQGGVVVADGKPGVFDEHSRRLATPALTDLFPLQTDGPVTVRTLGAGKAITLHADTVNYLTDRLMDKEGPVKSLIAGIFHSNGIRPEFAVTDSSGGGVTGIETHVFRNGGAFLITLLSNPLLRVDELGPPDFRSNKRFENPITVDVKLPAAMYLYDTRSGKAMGQKTSLTVTVQPYDPVMLAASPSPLPQLAVTVPASAQRGATARIGLACPQTSAAIHVLHVDVLDPTGKRVLSYSGNVLVENGAGEKMLPFAASDAPGTWTVRVHDLLSGQVVTRSLRLS